MGSEFSVLEDVVLRILQSEGEPMVGAQLGAAVQSQYQDFLGRKVDWPELGFEKFGDVLERISANGKVEIIKPVGAGDWTVRLSSKDGEHKELLAAPEDVWPERIPKHIWQAFTERSSVFVFRRDGNLMLEVVGGTVSDVSEVVTGDRQLVSVVQPSPTEEHMWIRMFMQELGKEKFSEIAHAIATRPDAENASYDFVKHLGEDDRKAWFAFRAGQTVQHIQKWVAENAIDAKALLNFCKTQPITLKELATFPESSIEESSNTKSGDAYRQKTESEKTTSVSHPDSHAPSKIAESLRAREVAPSMAVSKAAIERACLLAALAALDDACFRRIYPDAMQLIARLSQPAD